MTSASAVKLLAHEIEQRQRGQSSCSAEPDVAAAVPNGDAVRRLTQEVEGRGETQRRSLMEEIDTAVQDIAREMRASGHAVTREMESMAVQQAHLGKDMTMQEQVRRVLLRESAVHSAFIQAIEDGVEVRNRWGTEGEVRLAVTSAGATEYDAMFENALRALNSNKLVYVVTVSGYKRAGVDVILSLASLAQESELTVGRETSVAEVISLIRAERLYKRPCGPGTTLEVKLVGPAGTLLPCHQLVTTAFECDAAGPEPDVENGVFYPLKVLTDPEEWRALGLSGVTRWQHVREKDFRDLFGMSKEAFEKLPDWKQIPLKKKHGLF